MWSDRRLRARGLGRLDYIAVTHGDADHLGGVGAVLRDFRPREVWAGVPVVGHPPLEAVRLAASATRTPWRSLQRGDRLEIGGAVLIVHHPAAPDWERQRVRNDDSVVLEVRYGAVSVWLTGDISRAVEQELLSAADPRRLNVLKAAHHGSLTSSAPAWLARLRPPVVLISAGRGNLYGHPAPAVLQRFADTGAEVFRTDHGRTDRAGDRRPFPGGEDLHRPALAVALKNCQGENTKGTKARRTGPLLIRRALMLTRAKSVLDSETDDLVNRIIGCGLQVHRSLGPGYLESVYHDGMAIELKTCDLPFDRELFTPIRYRGQVLRGHKLDLVVAGKVVVELKAVERLQLIHTSQVVAYLRASGLRVGLLMNFNTPVLRSALRRIVL